MFSRGADREPSYNPNRRRAVASVFAAVLSLGTLLAACSNDKPDTFMIGDRCYASGFLPPKDFTGLTADQIRVTVDPLRQCDAKAFFEDTAEKNGGIIWGNTAQRPGPLTLALPDVNYIEGPIPTGPTPLNS